MGTQVILGGNPDDYRLVGMNWGKYHGRQGVVVGHILRFHCIDGSVRPMTYVDCGVEGAWYFLDECVTPLAYIEWVEVPG
jgi:hypothetical protein